MVESEGEMKKVIGVVFGVAFGFVMLALFNWLWISVSPVLVLSILFYLALRRVRDEI
jgi:4-hydroxybenzoate polyprenyltransferase